MLPLVFYNTKLLQSANSLICGQVWLNIYNWSRPPTNAFRWEDRRIGRLAQLQARAPACKLVSSRMTAGSRCVHDNNSSAVRDYWYRACLPRGSLPCDSVPPGTQLTSEQQLTNCTPEQNHAVSCCSMTRQPHVLWAANLNEASHLHEVKFPVFVFSHRVGYIPSTVRRWKKSKLYYFSRKFTLLLITIILPDILCISGAVTAQLV
jgi:hypothetical protein